jgi:hypothetical protein
MKDETKEAVDFMLEMLERKGAAVSTVKDGHVILFKRSFLEELLAKKPEQERFMIFLQRPEFKN